MARHASPLTARFWVWINAGWVKLALKEGQSLSWAEGHVTDEGWSAQAETYSRLDDVITCEWRHEGRDCDGYLEQYGQSSCHVTQLAAKEPFDPSELPEGAGVPEWVKGTCGQYDQSAALAGY